MLVLHVRHRIVDRLTLFILLIFRVSGGIICSMNKALYKLEQVSVVL